MQKNLTELKPERKRKWAIKLLESFVVPKTGDEANKIMNNYQKVIKKDVIKPLIENGLITCTGIPPAPLIEYETTETGRNLLDRINAQQASLDVELDHALNC